MVGRSFSIPFLWKDWAMKRWQLKEAQQPKWALTIPRRARADYLGLEIWPLHHAMEEQQNMHLISAERKKMDNNRSKLSIICTNDVTRKNYKIHKGKIKKK